MNTSKLAPRLKIVEGRDKKKEMSEGCVETRMKVWKAGQLKERFRRERI